MTEDSGTGSRDRTRSEIRRIRSSSARLAAVQALYAFDVDAPAGEERPHQASIRIETLVRAFMDGSLGSLAMIDVPDPLGVREPTEEREDLAPPDGELFGLLARGTVHERARIDEVLRASLSSDWPWERLEPLLRAVLRVSIYELLERPSTPVPVIIKEYVDLAASFYSGPERGLVNAVLDRLGRTLRSGAAGTDGFGS
ncbi:transcription antitermination factor NusB [Phaeovibrio sulfidiphilus]|uniref:Transcription antitermination protein NusB n=1 Tax=Phaeovibrio sulfidiphilus TaxID=1220600 RepID=A0A8J6YMW5_9PROT|nr:transcription antitermination factor NusB [Phaeovibrio sulfidiphilus]MBE1236819.1 transcription antitermination factor NusB [Phaeovibrio sulfidiphilus]